MNTPQSITTLGESPEEERNRRMTRYLIAMGIRTLCVILCFFVQGWWLVLPILGAVVLPYVAVVIANASTRPTGGAVEPVQFSLPAPDRGDAER
ncbi:DUF3099 domain-containing protein [Schumannella luteola]|jgi:hypothetical protein